MKEKNRCSSSGGIAAKTESILQFVIIKFLRSFADRQGVIITFQTRCEYFPVRSNAASLPHTV
jgi:hypothetical protein